MVGARTRQSAKRGRSVTPIAAIPTLKRARRPAGAHGRLVRIPAVTIGGQNNMGERGRASWCRPAWRVCPRNARYLTRRAPQNGTLTACGMSVTALAATMLTRQQDPQADHQDGGALTVMRRRQAARRCTHPRTVEARVTPNTATREMAAHLPAMPGPAMTPTASPHTGARPGPAMTSTLVTAGRPTTQMPGQR
jgi:hypothetical protein